MVIKRISVSVWCAPRLLTNLQGQFPMILCKRFLLLAMMCHVRKYTLSPSIAHVSAHRLCGLPQTINVCCCVVDHQRSLMHKEHNTNNSDNPIHAFTCFQIQSASINLTIILIIKIILQMILVPLALSSFFLIQNNGLYLQKHYFQRLHYVIPYSRNNTSRFPFIKCCIN